MKELKLQKHQFLLDRKKDILNYLDKNSRIAINSNPGIGKTYLFVDVAIEILKKKRKGRLIFCAPYLIIQSQFETGLAAKSFKVDLKLNYLSKRKALRASDKIITSTYQSFKLISNELTKEDIVVIDEAHSLSKSYGYKPIDKTFYSKEVFALINTKAKLVLLSGTPNKEINQLLNTETLKITKKGIAQAKIHLRRSIYKPVDIAVGFAEQAIKEFGDDHLNIIFIKNTKECELIKDRLNKKGYKTAIVTSYHKKELTYKELVKEETVEKNVQFLICTNIISTGTNIKNSKIGAALMIKETNPAEIKQFAKRFRKKLDLEVYVVNDGNRTGLVNLTLNIDTCINDQRKEIKQLTKERVRINNSKIPETYSLTYDSSNTGTKSNLESIIVDRIVKQISFLDDMQSERCTDFSNLDKELNKYDDIKATNFVKTLKPYSSPKSKSVPAKATFEKEISDIRQRFMDDSENYHNAIFHSESIDYYLNLKYKSDIGIPLLKSLPPNKTIEKDLNNPYFEKRILEPLLDTYPFIEDIENTLYLTENLSQRVLNKLKITLYTTRFRENYIEFSDDTDNYRPKVKSKLLLDKETNFYADFISEIYLKCLGQPSIPLSVLKNHLDKKFVKKLKSIQFTKSPLDKLIVKNEISPEKLRAILDGLIYSYEKTNKVISKTGVELKSVIFQEMFPNRPKICAKDCSEFFDKIKESIILRYTKSWKASELPFGLGTKCIIIPNPELVLHRFLINKL